MPVRMPLRRAAIAATGLLVALLIVTSPNAAAHAEFVSAFPGPYDILYGTVPSSVTITVSEAVQPGSATIDVTNATGARIDRPPTVLSSLDPTTFSVPVPGIGPGVYTVSWSVISADDGHLSAGSYYFMIRNPDGSLPGAFPQAAPPPPPSTTGIVLQAADFIGFALAFGPLAFLLLLWLPVRETPSGAASGEEANPQGSLLRLSRIGTLLLLAAVGAEWLSNLAASPPATPAAAVGSPYLASLALRTGLGAAMAVLVSLDLLRDRTGRGVAARPELMAAVVAGFGIILADVFASHSTLVEAWWPLGPFADAIHLYAAALWVGGLASVLRVRRWLTSKASPEFAVTVLGGFARVALLSVAMIIAAGAVMSVFLVGSLYNFVATGYGWIILGKASLLAPAVALGAWNRRSLARGMQDEAKAEVQVTSVGKRVRAEVVLGVAILVLAGWLTTVNPAALPAANPSFTLSANMGGMYVLFQVFPYPETPGNYTFTVQAWVASNGSVYIGAASANNTLTFSLSGLTSPIVVALQGPHGFNHFYAISDVVSLPGTWHVVVHLSFKDGSSLNVPFDVPIHP